MISHHLAWLFRSKRAKKYTRPQVGNGYVESALPCPFLSLLCHNIRYGSCQSIDVVTQGVPCVRVDHCHRH